MNLHDFHMEVTASERRCTCFGCKEHIAPNVRHLRLQSVDKSYCFKLCETCLQEAVFRIHEGDMNIKIIKSRKPKIDEWIDNVDLPQ
jgi:hypothetical protein